MEYCLTRPSNPEVAGPADPIVSHQRFVDASVPDRRSVEVSDDVAGLRKGDLKGQPANSSRPHRGPPVEQPLRAIQPGLSGARLVDSCGSRVRSRRPPKADFKP